MAQDDSGWHRWVMEANTQTAGFQPAPANPQPVSFGAPHVAPPDDPVALLPDAAAAKMVALRQRASDIYATVPSHQQVQETRLEALGYQNRIDHLTKHASQGGFGLDPATAPQVRAELKKKERAEKELARLVELKEVRTVRWNSAAQLERSVTDWLMHGGVPHGCVLDPIEDQPVSELLTKADGGRIEAAVERYRMVQRQCAAERHRVNSQQWPVSMAEAAARELIAGRAETGAVDFEAAIEHNLPIRFARTRLQSQILNAQPGAVGFAEPEDAVGLICWLFGQELLEKIRAGFREIADGDALDERQRAEMLATIDADSLSAERSEVSLIWHAAAECNEIIDFRATTTPMAAIGVALRTVPRAPDAATSPEHGTNITGAFR